MYPKPNEHLEKGRITKGRLGTPPSYGNNGIFAIMGPERHKLYMIASDGGAWEHVSVSVHNKSRTPTWLEMCFVKDLWWLPEEVVVQYHPRETEYINFQGQTLHLWRPVAVELPMPPYWMVGPKGVEDGLELMAEATGKKPIDPRRGL